MTVFKWQVIRDRREALRLEAQSLKQHTTDGSINNNINEDKTDAPSIKFLFHNQLENKKTLNENVGYPFWTEERLAFLDLLIKASETNPDFNDDDIREEVDTVMFAVILVFR